MWCIPTREFRYDSCFAVLKDWDCTLRATDFRVSQTDKVLAETLSVADKASDGQSVVAVRTGCPLGSFAK